ncbi:MAG TPA: helix-turn-helix transcriptional regulator [Burkholderiales bacterium]|nr:helix-turn-helix transcriptional regulator [Burkholderiales bacterium]
MASPYVASIEQPFYNSISRYMLQESNRVARVQLMDVNFDDTAFYDAIEARRQAESLSWRQLGRKLALSPSTFSRLARGRRPDVETFVRLLAWLDLPAETFMKGLASSHKRMNQDTLAVVAATLRADRTIPSAGAGALEQLMRVAYARLTAPQHELPMRGPSSKRSRTEKQ